MLRVASQALHAQLSQLSERYEKLAAKQQKLDAAAQLGALRRAPLVGLTAAALGKHIYLTGGSGTAGSLGGGAPVAPAKPMATRKSPARK